MISTPENPRPLTPNTPVSTNLSANASSQTSTTGGYFRTTSPNPSVMSGVMTSNEARTRKRTPGRAQKLVGDLLVLSGRLPEAVNAYVA
jgi:hypothetical protein